MAVAACWMMKRSTMNKQREQAERILAYKTEKRSHSPVDLLREALDKAERRVVSLDGTNIEEFLVSLDQIEQRFEVLNAGAADIRSEEGRWQSLLARLSSKPEPIAAAAAKAGGMATLRTQHPPAESFWWQLDAEVARRRMKMLKRIGLNVFGLVALIVFVLWGVDYFFPPNPNTILLVNTTNDVEQLVTEQKWDAALQRVQATRKTLPDEPELLVWEGVLYEQLGDAKHAQASLTHAQQLTKDQPVGFWLLVGNKRFQAGNVNGATDAANQALKIAPEEPQATLLLAAIAEARGDRPKAIELFTKTADFARKANNAQLEVIAKMRMGTLMQQVNPFASSETTPTTTITPTTK